MVDYLKKTGELNQEMSGKIIILEKKVAELEAKIAELQKRLLDLDGKKEEPKPKPEPSPVSKFDKM
mgnify:CR=1 FL=1